MQNGGMMQMMMVMEMMKGNSPGESGAGGGFDMSTMMALFGGGEAPVVESVWEDVVSCGTSRDKNGEETAGILEIRVTPPHADDPVPRVRIKSTGLIMSRPDHLKKVAAAFNRWADDELFHQAWDDVNDEEVIKKAEEEAAGKRSSAAVAALL